MVGSRRPFLELMSILLKIIINLIELVTVLTPLLQRLF